MIHIDRNCVFSTLHISSRSQLFMWLLSSVPRRDKLFNILLLRPRARQRVGHHGRHEHLRTTSNGSLALTVRAVLKTMSLEDGGLGNEQLAARLSEGAAAAV